MQDMADEEAWADIRGVAVLRTEHLLVRVASADGLRGERSGSVLET